jgi:fructose-bisphosphate aldolase class I
MAATDDLENTAGALVADGKGILAADETVPNLTRRLAARRIESTPESRRAYRELFCAAPGASEFISGVILHDETIRQRNGKGIALADVLRRNDIIPGIKVDLGARPLAGSPGEHVSEGLDGLRERLTEYAAIGARFAAWRAAIVVGHVRPTAMCVRDNAHALARFAALCQDQGILPVVEPEVLADGGHTIERCEEVTAGVLHAVVAELFDQNVRLEGLLLKANMITSGSTCSTQASPALVARATLRCLRRHVPAALSGIVFLSGEQDPFAATAHLAAINCEPGPKPWKLTFAFGRALQDEAIGAWGGWPENVKAAQRAFLGRARLASAAALGRYTPDMEQQTAVA